MSDIKKFEELNVSTSTVMVYSNLNFNLDVIFENLPISQNVELAYTKKQQQTIDKKKLISPYGSIISIQKNCFIRGVNTRKNKKRWCSFCKLTTSVNDHEKKILTCSEVAIPHKNDIFEIRYFCNVCKETYKLSAFKRIGHFLNQTTFDFSTGENQPMLNVMIFKDSIKIAGCKFEEDAVKMIQFLWSEYLSKIAGFATLKIADTKPSFTIETVMKNYGFNLGFGILREPLNILMNDPEYADKIYMSEYESTGHTNVNIKMFSKKPDDFKYTFIEFDNFFEPTNTIQYVDEISNKKKNKKVDYVTFIVFSSAEVILSGRYTENMRELYNFFRKIIHENRGMLEEILIE